MKIFFSFLVDYKEAQKHAKRFRNIKPKIYNDDRLFELPIPNVGPFNLANETDSVQSNVNDNIGKNFPLFFSLRLSNLQFLIPFFILVRVTLNLHHRMN